MVIMMPELVLLSEIRYMRSEVRFMISEFILMMSEIKWMISEILWVMSDVRMGAYRIARTTSAHRTFRRLSFRASGGINVTGFQPPSLPPLSAPLFLQQMEFGKGFTTYGD
jgi:hypothetical protein